MIGERREARTKSQAQIFHISVDIKEHSKLVAVLFNFLVMLSLAVLFKYLVYVCLMCCLYKAYW